MQTWAEEYRNVLTRSGVEVLLLAGYVDDGRQGTTSVPMGTRYDKQENKLKYNIEAAIVDQEKKLEGDSINQRRVCLDIMNSNNQDLDFTVVCQEDFQNERLPTLDFSLWQEKSRELNHSYFQKEMKTRFVVMNRSAMGTQQKSKLKQIN